MVSIGNSSQSLFEHYAIPLIGSEATNFLKEVYSDKSWNNNVQPSSFIEEYWVNCYNRFGEFNFVLVVYAFLILAYTLAGVLCALIDIAKLFKQYKIQPGKYGDVPGYLMCIVNLVQNYILIIVPLLFVGYPIFTYLGFRATLPLPSAVEFISHFIFFLFAEDFTHFVLHRALHTPYLYKTIHKIHHTYQAPFGLVASYAHPLEILILGFCTFSGPLILAPHYFTFFVWIIYRQLEAVATHSGYEFPNIFEKIPFYGGAKAHDYHHKIFNCNYSSRFTYLDVLFGTYKEPPSMKWKSS